MLLLDAVPAPLLAWGPCPDPNAAAFECATARVPLDYRNPWGRSIQLAVIRYLAADSAHRIGTLFFNPGGPGGAGTEDLPAWIDYFPPAVRQRFDLVSWDPRGIGSSTHVQCFATEGDENTFFSGVPFNFFPVGNAEKRAWISRFALFSRICQQRNGDLLEHVSTIDVVRDLELLRRAVGDPQLNFIGVSYGTFLGALYANLFPGNVRAMVLDGNVDPVAWTNGGKEFTFLSTSLRLGSDIAAADTLDAFLDLCGQASTDQCAFSAGSPSATHAKWKTLLQRVREHPVGTDGQTITYAALSSAMVAWLTTTEPLPGSFKGWVYAANVLQALWQTTTPGAAPDSAMPADPIAFTPETTSQSYEGIEQQFAVECSESPNPRDPLVFQALDLLSFARAGDVGPYLSWGDEGCASWPAAAERYNGPWDRYTAAPILVIGNTLDPDTPYKGATAMVNDLARGRLLTVEGYGHTTLLNPSTCANDFETQYLVDGKLPPPGTVCYQDTQPFTSSQ